MRPGGNAVAAGDGGVSGGDDGGDNVLSAEPLLLTLAFGSRGLDLGTRFAVLPQHGNTFRFALRLTNINRLYKQIIRKRKREAR